MWWSHGDWSWGGWFVMALFMVGFWAAVLWAIVAVGRAGTAGTPSPPERPTAEQVLAERLARGEIDEEEYRRRRAVLRSPRDAPGAGPRGVS